MLSPILATALLFMQLCPLLLWPCPASAIDVTRDPSLNQALNSAPTQLDADALLASSGGDSAWVFDFTKQANYTFEPGSVINANAATFPAAVGHGMTMALLNLGPCAMLPPHFHPRAVNYALAISGTTQTFMYGENGAELVAETLTPGKMTIFPQASVHTMMNLGCDNAQLVSALNSADPGTTNLGGSMQVLPEAIYNAAFGYQNISTDSSRGQIPPVGTGSAWGPKECLARCAAANATKGPSCTMLTETYPSGNPYFPAAGNAGQS